MNALPTTWFFKPLMRLPKKCFLTKSFSHGAGKSDEAFGEDNEGACVALFLSLMPNLERLDIVA